MQKLFQKIDRIRASGLATLKVEEGSAYAHLNGKKFKVQSMGIPDIKCRVTLIIDKTEVDFNIDQVC